MALTRTVVIAALSTGMAVGIAACSHARTAPATAPASAPAQRPAPTGNAGGAPGGAPGTPRVRRPPNWALQDSTRKATVAQLMKEIAGHEQEPAGKVFKNVRVLKNMPAADFLKNMDEVYGRGLGRTCVNCHVEGNFASDQKKGKIIGRQMQVMTDGLNKQYLSKIKELDEDYEKATCVSCHKSDEKVHNKMAQPTNPPAPGR